jgi:hypothetical protein
LIPASFTQLSPNPDDAPLPRMIASQAEFSAGGSGRNISPTRSVACPDAARRCSVAISRADVAPSIALVMPKLFNTPSAILNWRNSSTAVHSGTDFSTRSIAVSTRTPVNSPEASRSKRPPLGSAVPFSTPALASARVFAIEK